jgi:hypothetical protein
VSKRERISKAIPGNRKMMEDGGSEDRHSLETGKLTHGTEPTQPAYLMLIIF